mgnify:CR=1 FL=1
MDMGSVQMIKDVIVMMDTMAISVKVRQNVVKAAVLTKLSYIFLEVTRNVPHILP